MDKPYFIGYWFGDCSQISNLSQYRRVFHHISSGALGTFSGIEITKDECIILKLKFPNYYILDRGIFFQLMPFRRSELINILNELRPLSITSTNIS